MEDGPVDVLESVPPERRQRPGFRPERALLAVLVLALAGAIAAAVIYHNDAAGLRRRLRAAPTPAPVAGAVALPAVTSNTVMLETTLPFAGEVTIFTAVEPAAGLAQVVVTAKISGARPNTQYDLVGNDCSSGAPDHRWAGGVTDFRGAADLSGNPWTVRTNDDYFLVVQPWGNRPAPGVHGEFAFADVSAFPPGVAPCSP